MMNSTSEVIIQQCTYW